MKLKQTLLKKAQKSFRIDINSLKQNVLKINEDKKNTLVFTYLIFTDFYRSNISVITNKPVIWFFSGEKSESAGGPQPESVSEADQLIDYLRV